MSKITIRPQVVPKSQTEGSTVLIFEGLDTKIIGTPPGLIDVVCGECGHLLIESVYPGSVAHLFIRCPNCKSYNRIVDDLIVSKSVFAALAESSVSVKSLEKLKASVKLLQNKQASEEYVLEQLIASAPLLSTLSDPVARTLKENPYFVTCLMQLIVMILSIRLSVPALSPQIIENQLDNICALVEPSATSARDDVKKLSRTGNIKSRINDKTKQISLSKSGQAKLVAIINDESPVGDELKQIAANFKKRHSSCEL